MPDRTSTHSDSTLLLRTLRDVLKAKKYTYARLAEELGVSEVTVKRWFTGKTCSMESVFEICDLLGISFFDLAALAANEEEVDYVLTSAQENEFSKRPALFGVFKQLHRGENPEQVAERWGLSTSEFYRVLRALEKLGLLDVLPENRIRMKVRGNIRYGHRGALAKTILRPQILQFLDHVDHVLENDDVCMHSVEVELSEAHLSELVDEIHALGSKYRARAYRDKSLLPSKKLKPVRWLLALAPYETDWRQYKL